MLLLGECDDGVKELGKALGLTGVGGSLGVGRRVGRRVERRDGGSGG